MDQVQSASANDEYQRWLESTPLSSRTGLTARDGFFAAMDLMLGTPLSVGNLEARIDELEERLRTVGGKHAQQVRDLEYQIANQTSLIKDKNNKIHDLEIEIQDWKKRLDDYSRIYQQEMEDRHRDELNDAVASAVSEALNEAAQQTAQALEEQKEHFEQVKEAALSAQSQVLRQEFGYRLAGSQSGFVPQREHQDEMERVRLRLWDQYQTQLEQLEAENESLKEKVGSADQRVIDQITNFTDRMLADQSYRQGVVEDRIFTRIDEVVPILKAMVAIELRQKPESKPIQTILPTMEDFEYWYDQIPDSTMSDKDKFRLGWQGALRHVR